jgi:hypothetical protein
LVSLQFELKEKLDKMNKQSLQTIVKKGPLSPVSFVSDLWKSKINKLYYLSLHCVIFDDEKYEKKSFLIGLYEFQRLLSKISNNRLSITASECMLTETTTQTSQTQTTEDIFNVESLVENLLEEENSEVDAEDMVATGTASVSGISQLLQQSGQETSDKDMDREEQEDGTHETITYYNNNNELQNIVVYAHNFKNIGDAIQSLLNEYNFRNIAAEFDDLFRAYFSTDAGSNYVKCFGKYLTLKFKHSACMNHALNNLLKRIFFTLKKKYTTIKHIDDFITFSITKLSKSEYATKFKPKLKNYINIRFYSKFDQYYSFFHNHNRILAIYKKLYNQDKHYINYNKNSKQYIIIIIQCLLCIFEAFKKAILLMASENTTAIATKIFTKKNKA